MEEFLKELEKLLTKYEATILRSAASTHKLVISVLVDEVFKEIEFDEEINDSMLKHKWYEELN